MTGPEATLLVFLVGWMLAVTAAQAVTGYQVNRIVKNHLPHIDQQIESLLLVLNEVSELPCKHHDQRIKDLEES